MYTHIPSWTLWIFVPVFAIRVGFRLRRFLAYQPLSLSHELWSSGFLAAGVIGMAIAAADVRASVAALGGGVATGLVVGIWAVRRARIDRTANGLYFQPSPYIGAALSALLLGRIVWRLIAGPATDNGWTAAELLHNPSTLYLFGLFAAHYLAFSTGLIRARLHSGARNGPPRGGA